HVGDDAQNLTRRLAHHRLPLKGPYLDPVANRISARPPLPRQRLVNHDDRSASSRVTRTKCRAAPNQDAHCFEEVRRNDPNLHAADALFRMTKTLSGKVILPSQGKNVYGCGPLDTFEAPQLLVKSFDGDVLPRLLSSSLGWPPERQDPAGPEAQCLGVQLVET